jgi:predicted DNA binding CopG/RHH family protein
LKNLKSTRPAPAIAPDDMLRIASVAAPQQPSAVTNAEGADKSAMLSVRMTEATLEALANYAVDHGTTQRRVIAEALAAHGIRVSARDLEDRPLPRRRGRR